MQGGPLGLHVGQLTLELRLDGGDLLLVGGPLVAHRLQLGLLILNLLDNLRLLSLLALEVRFHRLHGRPLLLQLGNLAAVFANDVVEEEDSVHQVGKVGGGKHQFQPTHLAALVHDAHSAPEIGDMLGQLRLLERQFHLGLVDLLTDDDQLYRFLVDLGLHRP